ncbi:MAG: radical SAM protein [Myxococcota bacterium]|nr:radical SAM protein [Myxococcota bacterium]
MAGTRDLVRTPTDQDFKRPTPVYVVWELTLKCDLGCKTCGSRAGKPRAQELTLEECYGVIDQLAEAGTREVTIIGGEAYLRDDWPLIAKRITDRGMACSMTTGARGLTQERLDLAVKAGLRSISISLDGLEETHDAQRGVKGSWRSAVEAAKRVAKSPIRLATNTQVNRLSLPELPAVADTMVEIGSKAWQVQITVAMGRAADRPDMLLQPYELLELFPLLVWIKEHKLEPNGIRLFPGNNVGFFSPYEERLRYHGDTGAHWRGCPAGSMGLGIEADGTLKGCPSLATETYSGGNVLDRPIIDMVEHAPEINHIRQRTRNDLWGFCQTCYYADICRGGCTWTSSSLLGRPGNNPYCIHRAMEFEKQGLRERVEQVSVAPGLPFDHGEYRIVVEPMPNDVDTTIGGVPLPLVLAAQRNDPGLSTPESLRIRLQKSPGSGDIRRHRLR